ncbi:MAG TPA: hypothetical protein VGG06_35450 [Thermoanaerobaculia bacterium]|jgi:hypothetical protein
MDSPYALHRPVDNSYLVRQRDRRRLRELLAVAAAVLVLGGALFAYTWVHVELLRTGYRIDELETRLHEVLEAERKWRLEAAYAAHPERVEQRARQDLAMTEPSLDQTIFYEEILAQVPSLDPPGGPR